MYKLALVPQTGSFLIDDQSDKCAVLCNYVRSTRAFKSKLDVQGRSLRLGQGGLVWLERVLHLGRDELFDLLRSTASEGARIKEGVQFTQDGGKELGATDAFQEVVVLAMLLDVVGGLMREDACNCQRKILMFHL